MKKNMFIVIKSLLLGVSIFLVSLYLLSFTLNPGYILGIISRIVLTSTLIFCTYMIADEIKKLNKLLNCIKTIKNTHHIHKKTIYDKGV